MIKVIQASVEILEPNILLSLLNMKLRDQYSSLDLLCEDLNLDKDFIVNKLKNIGYTYSQKENQFKTI
ncbi:DUF4250 domain-containing protein [Clostridium sp. BJN0001]|uniref:DUF4250 domain-containing protein n=1 Tax=Clostridium sp. BJN0001 TaxID=2930219 RepID=UPI001FD2E459|nr:DUF4250 domain-containing protein [Clostridium sp. BJN0001]